jgi:hypothetical protein
MIAESDFFVPPTAALPLERRVHEVWIYFEPKRADALAGEPAAPASDVELALGRVERIWRATALRCPRSRPALRPFSSALAKSSSNRVEPEVTEAQATAARIPTARRKN